MGLALGLVVVIISVVSFTLALYLHIAITLKNAIKTDQYSGKVILEAMDQEIITDILKKGIDIYNSIPEEERSDPLSKEYLSKFDELKTEQYFLINRWLVKPIVSLSNAAVEYVDKEDKEKNTGHFDVVDIKSHDELLQLKNSMIDMESDLVRYMQNLSRMTAEKEREAVEMELSSRIQTSLLPQKFDNYTGEKTFEINAFIDPARDVGGDFYDYYVIDEDHLGLTIADVSGKGVPAALFMVIYKKLLQMAGINYKSHAEVLRIVNKKLCDQNQEMMFVTVFFGIYTLSEKKLIYVNAGHEYPVLYRESAGSFSMIKEEHDLFMGYMPEADYTERTLYLERGDKLFLYTDGIPDARNTSDAVLGEQRMIDDLNSLKDLSGKELLQKMRDRISSFAGDAPQFDDVTMLLLEIT